MHLLSNSSEVKLAHNVFESKAHKEASHQSHSCRRKVHSVAQVGGNLPVNVQRPNKGERSIHIIHDRNMFTYHIFFFETWSHFKQNISLGKKLGE